MSSSLLPNQTPEFAEAPEEFPVRFESADPESSISTAEEIEAQVEEGFRDGLMTRLGEAPAWAVSLVVHLGVLLFLGSLTKVTEMMLTEDIISTPVEEIDVETYAFESTVQDEMGNDSDVNKESTSLLAANLQGESEPQEIQQKIEDAQVNIDVEIADLLQEPSRADLTALIETNGTTEHPGGTEGAMDRLAFEISNTVHDGETLVVWLFDASLSVQERRDMIADRFQNIYKQVGLRGVGESDRLLTAAVSFGANTSFLIDEPTSDIEPLAAKIRMIPADETGKEMVFTALEDVSRKWGSYRTSKRRNVMYIIVTDERGDDFDKMDKVIANLTRVGIRVYCVGNAAVFGKQKGYVRFTWDEDGQSFTEDLPVDQGPESFYPELLDIDFWGLADKGRLNNLSSSFGPYPLNRLCAETGGLYLVAEESKRAVKYDHEVMRAYQPDYMRIDDLEKVVQSNRAISSLIQASNALRIDRISMPTLSFDAQDDNTLRNELLAAQKPVSVLEYRIQSVVSILEEGVKDREKIAEPRWRAAYDLAVGRALALHVRAKGYGLTLAEMRTNLKPFEDPKSNFWYLRSSEDMGNATPSVRKIARQAEEYLTRVIDEHPGTPWAQLAAAELEQPLGWSWEEASISREGDVMTRNGNNDAARLLLAEEIRRRQQRTPRPQPKKRPPL